jgi:hypothetical protein
MEDSNSFTEPTSIHEEFKLAVKNYITISDELEEIQNATKEKRKKIKKLTEFILIYMQDNKKEVCNLGESGTLIVKESKSKKTLNKDYVQEMLRECSKNDDIAKTYAEYVFENQAVNIKPKLHRSKYSD